MKIEKFLGCQVILMSIPCSFSTNLKSNTVENSLKLTNKNMTHSV